MSRRDDEDILRRLQRRNNKKGPGLSTGAFPSTPKGGRVREP